MIDPTFAGLVATSVGSISAAAGAIAWGATWRKVAIVNRSDADFFLEQRDAAEASHNRTHDALATLASDNSRLRRELRDAESRAEHFRPKRDAKGHFIKSNGTALTG